MINLGMYTLKDRQPVYCHEVEVWGLWMAKADRTVAVTEVEQLLTVSTVFLGLDHRFGGNGPPILFETMIFGDIEDSYQTRCSTWEQAEEMHRVAVEYAREQVAKAEQSLAILKDKFHAGRD